jgi:hypothetical protein
MSKTEACIWLSPADRTTLEGWISGRNTPQKLVWRARIVLLSADRMGVMAITRAVGKSKVTVSRWQERYLAKGIAGLQRDATRPGRKPPLPGDQRGNAAIKRRLRLVVCKNLLLAEELARKCEALLMGTESALKHTQARVEWEKNPLRGAAAIDRAVGAVLGKYQVGKHFHIEIGEASLSFSRNETAIAAEAALVGIYVLRSSLTAEQADAATTVRAYKSLAHVERAFRLLKRTNVELRPVFHWTASRAWAHVLLCMLVYYPEWHMRRALAPMLFDDHDPARPQAQHSSPVVQAKPSAAAPQDRAKANRAGRQRVAAGA